MAVTFNFSDLLSPGLAALYRYGEDDEIKGLEARAYDMGWVRKKEDKWALIGPVICIRSTEKALLIRLIGEASEGWVPKSMLHLTENEITQTGDQGFLVIPEWLAKEKGWL